MEFKEGNAVEVWRREKDPYASWFCGNIIAEDGDYCIVRYELLADEGGEAIIEKVHKEDIRPQPPHHGRKRWTIGDIAEAFDMHCWRLGKVVKVFKNNRLVFKFFGSIQLKEVHASDLRIQQIWHENNWSVIIKVQNNKQEARNCKQKYTFKPSWSLVCNAREGATSEETCSPEKKSQKFVKKGISNRLGFCTSIRNRKNGHAPRPESSSKDLVLKRSVKKREGSGGCQRPFLKNYPFKQVGSTTLHLETWNKPTEIDVEEARNFWVHNCFHPKHSEGSNKCSIASCNLNSIADDCSRSYDKLMEVVYPSSDAESTFPSLSSKKYPSQSSHKLNVDIHKLELQAYKSTVQALHASGPLSWEQESLLTNLRLSLHISNEEHLYQLRHLLAAQVL